MSRVSICNLACLGYPLGTCGLFRLCLQVQAATCVSERLKLCQTSKRQYRWTGSMDMTQENRTRRRETRLGSHRMPMHNLRQPECDPTAVVGTKS